MFPSFAFPLALIGLAAIPVLIAVYWLRNRHRRVTVSSLMLWIDEREAREGGLLFHRLQTPLLFWIELLTILLLVLAAAGPLVRAGQSSTPLVVVLDDSFSMLAGGEDSARNLAAKALKDELEAGSYLSVQLVLAGESPQLTGGGVMAAREAIASLAEWTCLSASSDLDQALAFASTLAGPRGRLLVLTDHPAAEEPSEGRLRWWAFGSALPNIAFTSAARIDRDGQQRCLIEFANLSREQANVSFEYGIQQPQRQTVALSPGAAYRITLNLEPSAGPLTARLQNDQLNLDNLITLLPQKEREVKVAIEVKDENLRELVETAVTASRRANIGTANPELLITDSASDAAQSNPDTWLIHLIVDPNGEAFVGPFVLDRAHRLTEGLSLDGVVWGAGKGLSLTGRPIITAGNTPLLAEVERPDGRHDLRMQFRPDLSSLQQTPNWPILIWNMISLRASNAAGFGESNVRLGSEASLNLPLGTQSLVVTDPSGRTRQLNAVGRTAAIRAEQPGLFEIAGGEEHYKLASNALSQEESDLSSCASGRWGAWSTTGGDPDHYSITWILILVAASLMVLHLALTSRRSNARA